MNTYNDTQTKKQLQGKIIINNCGRTHTGVAVNHISLPVKRNCRDTDETSSSFKIFHPSP
jgi:hypothetical protein